MKPNTLIASLAIAASLGILGCDDYGNTGTTPTVPNTPPPSSTTTTPPPAKDADNTERNRNDANPTALDQGTSESDVRITADIRRAILEDTLMSVNAQNCKVITRNGVVTLRGPVASQAEKDAIEAKAKAVAGVTGVDNQLEVKAP